MTALGLELNATRARAVAGPLGDFPCALPLDPPELELPLVISLEGSTPEVGSAGRALLRRLPHLACHGFLPRVGDAAAGHKWKAGRRSLDSNDALSLVFQRLAGGCGRCAGAILAVPAYLTQAQMDHLFALTQKTRLPIRGLVSIPLAGALAAHADQSWFGAVVVVDCDDHALTLSTVAAEEGTALLLETRVVPHLSLHVWKERLLNTLADCCVLQSRRDPRDSPAAEQALYEQLDHVFEACQHQRMIQLGLQANHWYQNLIVHPEQAIAFAAGLVQQTIAEIDALWHSAWPAGPPEVLLLTASVARLPGLLPALRDYFEEWTATFSRNGFHKRGTALHEDFGEDLLKEDSAGGASVVVLCEDAPARAAHGLLAYFQLGELPGGLLEKAPLPMPLPVEAGPARLHYQGQDYLLAFPTFTLGRQTGCDIVFDGDAFSHVAARHCEIIFDHRTYMLFDRSRDGTLVNDCLISGSVVLHPGDWIRLGPEGPTLRFLGRHTASETTLVTTA